MFGFGRNIQQLTLPASVRRLLLLHDCMFEFGSVGQYVARLQSASEMCMLRKIQFFYFAIQATFMTCGFKQCPPEARPPDEVYSNALTLVTSAGHMSA